MGRREGGVSWVHNLALVWYTDNSCIGHLGMQQGPCQLLELIRDVEEPILVKVPNVPRCQPPILGQSPAGSIRLVQISLHHVGTLDINLPLLSLTSWFGTGIPTEPGFLIP